MEETGTIDLEIIALETKIKEKERELLRYDINNPSWGRGQHYLKTSNKMKAEIQALKDQLEVKNR